MYNGIILEYVILAQNFDLLPCPQSRQPDDLNTCFGKAKKDMFYLYAKTQSFVNTFFW